MLFTLNSYVLGQRFSSTSLAIKEGLYRAYTAGLDCHLVPTAICTSTAVATCGDCLQSRLC